MLSLGWNGRQLQSIENGDYSVVYSYNTDEQRVRKVISTSDNSMTYTYEYFYNGSILAGQKLTKLEDSVEKVYTLAFMYDNNGDAFGFICNGEPYYYIKNAQNDVVLITDADGQAVVLYQYDAWGKITQCFDGTEDGIGLVNPLFYRSYYLDLEMEMYYLNSRYYLPIYHRLLNADAFTQTGQGLLDKNMFAYCLNNPVNYRDPSGHWCIYFPAEDNTPVTIVIDIDEPGLSISKDGDTYSVTPKSPPQKTSDKGVAFIAAYEAYYATPYDDGFGYITIGYGHVIQSGESFTSLTEAAAMELLAKDLHTAEQRVLNYSNSLGIVWDQNEFDALVSLSFNSGNNVKYVINSINSGMDPYDAFAKIINVKGRPVLGLYRRRMDEADIFTKGTYERTYRNW